MLTKGIVQVESYRSPITRVMPLKKAINYAVKFSRETGDSTLVRDSDGIFYLIDSYGCVEIVRVFDFYWTTENVIISARNVQEAWHIAQKRVGDARLIRTAEIVEFSEIEPEFIIKHAYAVSYL
jgi:hypothetical protein